MRYVRHLQQPKAPSRAASSTQCDARSTPRRAPFLEAIFRAHRCRAARGLRFAAHCLGSCRSHTYCNADHAYAISIASLLIPGLNDLSIEEKESGGCGGSDHAYAISIASLLIPGLNDLSIEEKESGGCGGSDHAYAISIASLLIPGLNDLSIEEKESGGCGGSA